MAFNVERGKVETTTRLGDVPPGTVIRSATTNHLYLVISDNNGNRRRLVSIPEGCLQVEQSMSDTPFAVVPSKLVIEG